MPFSLKSFFEKLKKVDKKKIIVASLVFSFAFLLIPLDSAFGFGIGSIGESIATAFTGVITVIVSGILTAFLALSSVWLIITESLFDWAYKANSGPLTHCPDENPGCFVDTSWAFIRDLANMVFILAIVIIAFATVLGFESYGMKKLLPTLVIMAVLINFSQFFVGVIVDISSVITDFFASTVEQTNLFAESFKTITSTATGNLHFFGEINKQIDIIFTFIAVLVMNCMMGLIFLIYAGIFILRIPMLWILTILSPLAFASRTLPFARGFNLIGWDSWIKQVTQWAFISAFALFYLHLVVMFSSEIFAIDSSTFEMKDEFGIQALVQDILPFGFIIIFMIIALQASMQTNAMFAGAAISGARKISANIQNRTTGMAKGAARGGVRAFKEETSPRAEKIFHTREKANRLSSGLSRSRIMRQTGVTEKIGAYGAGREGIISEGEKETEKMTANKVAQEVKNGKISNIRAVGALRKEGALTELEKLYGDDKQGFEKKINTILEEGKRSGPQNVDKLIAKNPALSSMRIAEERLKDKAFDRYKGETSYSGDKIKTKDDAWLEMGREALTKNEKVEFDNDKNEKQKKEYLDSKAVATRIGIRENIKSFDPSTTSANFWKKEQNIDAALLEMRLEDLEKIGRENPAARSRIQSYLGSLNPEDAQQRYSKLTDIYDKDRTKERLANVNFDLEQLDSLNKDQNVKNKFIVRAVLAKRELRSGPRFEEKEEEKAFVSERNMGRVLGLPRKTIETTKKIKGIDEEFAEQKITGAAEKIGKTTRGVQEFGVGTTKSVAEGVKEAPKKATNIKDKINKKWENETEEFGKIKKETMEVKEGIAKGASGTKKSIGKIPTAFKKGRGKPEEFGE